MQECAWFYAHENPAVSRNWEIHFRSVQQTFREYSRDDSPLHGEQTANPWGGAHVSLTSRHRTAALAAAFKAVIAAVRDYDVLTICRNPQSIVVPDS